MREKRAFTRIRLNAPASLFLYQVQVSHTASIVNLSRGGCLFNLDAELPVGEQCTIEFTSGLGLETKSISLPGTIVRTSQTGLGIEFSALSTENSVLLDHFISNNNV